MHWRRTFSKTILAPWRPMAHKVEVASTGRARCRACKQAIEKGALRFGEEFKNPYSEDGGMSYRYWHLPCAATKMANELGPALAAFEGEVPDRAALLDLMAQNVKPTMPFAERAPNGRARCRACREGIAKDELRVAFEREFEGPMGPQKGAAYAHARCLPAFLASEVEQGRTAPTPTELLMQLEAHAGAARSVPEDLATLRGVLLQPG
jgi:hypothetical protein